MDENQIFGGKHIEVEVQCYAHKTYSAVNQFLTSTFFKKANDRRTNDQ